MSLKKHCYLSLIISDHSIFLILFSNPHAIDKKMVKHLVEVKIPLANHKTLKSENNVKGMMKLQRVYVKL